MDGGILLLIAVPVGIVLLALIEGLLRKDRPHRTLAQTFGGTEARKERTNIDDQGMTPEMRQAMRQQLRLTAQSGVQGVIFGKRQKDNWQVLDPEAMSDPQAYAKLFVPKTARTRPLEESAPKPHTQPKHSKET
ncbi:MAG: hypothetical protein AAFQ36_12050 [Pseudomonadota bacterium]